MCDIYLLENIVAFRVIIDYPVDKSIDKLESEEIAYSAISSLSSLSVDLSTG